MFEVQHKEIITYLKTSELFSNIDESVIHQLVQRFEPVYLKSGDVIIKENEIGDCVYLILRGRLGIFKNDENGQSHIIGESRKGDLIGELALITQEPRTATVAAIRDSILLKLSKNSFDEFIARYPLQKLYIIRSAMQRIHRDSKGYTNKTKSIVLVPSAKENFVFDEFVKLFIKQLAINSKVLHLTEDNFHEHLKRNEINNFDSDQARAIQWLTDQEDQFEFIIYEVKPELTTWTNLSLHLSDKIFLIASSKTDEALNTVETAIFSSGIVSTKSIEFILIHPDHIQLPKNTRRWLTNRQVARHHHIKLNEMWTILKLIRFIKGKSIGLVCGGGGAHALGYLGLHKALMELNIPVDILGGTSAGAMVAAFIAHNYSPEKIQEILTFDSNKFIEFTIPMIGISSGRRWSNQLKKIYTEYNDIEDLWKSFFCIATNISQYKMDVLQTGLLWKAIRATTSLPAVFPPISNNNDDLLIDGGIVNNLPIDVMKDKMEYGKIIAIHLTLNSSFHAKIPDGILSGWKLFLQRFLPYKSKLNQMPNMTDIITNTIMICSQAHESRIAHQANILIHLDYSKFSFHNFEAAKEIIDEGYRQSMMQLKKANLNEILM